MAWDDTKPDGKEQANTIHTLMQTAKVDIRKIMQCDNGDFDEHVVCDTGETGEHVPSRTGFVRISTWANRLTSGLREGSLHYITDAPYTGLYIIDAGLNYERVSANDHDLLDDLEDNACHAFALRVDSSNFLTGVMELDVDPALSALTYGAGDGQPVDPDHHTDSWYAGHGADAIGSRHWKDGSLEDADMLEETGSSATSYSPSAGDRAKAYGYLLPYGTFAGTGIVLSQAAGAPTITVDVGATVPWVRIGAVSTLP